MPAAVRCGGADIDGVERLRQPEVQDLDRAVRTQLDVGGLQIAVNDAALVGRFQPFRNLFRDRQRLVDRNRARCAMRSCSVGSFDELQHERLNAIGVFETVNRRDVRMVQRGEDLRFAPEAREAIGIQREGRRPDLERDVAIEVGVARPVDLAHAAGADKLEDRVGTERIARLQGAPAEVGNPAGGQAADTATIEAQAAR